MNMCLQPKKIVLFLVVTTAVLTVLHIWSCMPVVLAGRSYPITYFNFDREGNLPTLFSTLLLLGCAALTFVIASAERALGKKAWQWWLLSFSFLCIGLDETMMLHDKLSEVVHQSFQTTGIFYFAWVLPYALLLILFVAVYIPFFLRLPRETKRMVAVAALLFVGGGMGLELPGGARFETHGQDGVFYLLATFEELLEMSGCIVFIYAFSSYIDRYIPDFKLRVSSQ